ncbi:hypothetical protein IQ260_01565 [Leptolyngbya cf. ectocarpi LEGE 11479]|uniref:NfeD-like C-terminal domain-containing protein n=1 Tax=Leptolyngbya cf. ectocarpi LEGE 11479 TaxID=1828722 RepID=A0A928WXP7_LEPEC|nr:hypothetical protein [Leptolyngbya ectocarpi]MBE9065334.1 hypothetical protein [Leptolyngbya cf. ectocarpi LEGE 11479]
MFVNNCGFFQANHLAPAPIYLPWLDDEQSEHEAVIEDILEPGKEWRVRYKASFWKAHAIKGNLNFSPKDVVQVVGRQNLTLLIQGI